jgi:hypothetical protein
MRLSDPAGRAGRFPPHQSHGSWIHVVHHTAPVLERRRTSVCGLCCPAIRPGTVPGADIANAVTPRPRPRLGDIPMDEGRGCRLQTECDGATFQVLGCLGEA